MSTAANHIIVKVERANCVRLTKTNKCIHVKCCVLCEVPRQRLDRVIVLSRRVFDVVVAFVSALESCRPC